jgi:hypothetical protein
MNCRRNGHVVMTRSSGPRLWKRDASCECESDVRQEQACDTRYTARFVQPKLRKVLGFTKLIVTRYLVPVIQRLLLILQMQSNNTYLMTVSVWKGNSIL